jgi:thiol-disulfide isomerase/thioredoxin
MQRKTQVVLGIVAFLACAAGAVLFQRHAAEQQAALAGAEAFYMQELPDATGAVRKMSDQRGKVVVVNFWATWCVPCVEEIPTLSKVHAAADGRVAFVGLGIDSPANIAGFNDRFKPSYPLLAAGSGGTELARVLGDEAGALPFTVVLGPDGRVIASHLGKVDAAMLDGWLQPYLAAPKS